MPYHFPIKPGDRVALAPHTDLWMRGVRFANVVAVSKIEPRYRIEFGGTSERAWARTDDLLGAVRHPSGQAPDSLCERLRFMDRKYSTVPESPLHHDKRCKDH